MEDNHPTPDKSEAWQASSADERPDFLAHWFQRRHKLTTNAKPDSEVLGSAQVYYEDMSPTEFTVPPSLSPETTEERIPPSLPEAIPDTDSLVEQRVAPKVVMEQTVEAAEHNQPLERAYERRQEIKDDPVVLQGRSGAVAVGDILSQSSSAQSTATQRQSASVATHELLLNRQAQTDNMYRSAVRTGLVAASVVVVFAVIIYLVTS